MYRILNVLKSIVWLSVILPMAMLGGVLAGAAVFLETAIRHGDDSWNPFHPIASARRGRLPDDLQPPVQVGE